MQPGHPYARGPPPDLDREPREKQRRRKRKRAEKTKRRRSKERKRKERNDCYFGLIDHIIHFPHCNAYELRLEAIAENSLSEIPFLRAAQKMAVAEGIPNFSQYRLALLNIYVRQLPPGIREGRWVNFKVKEGGRRAATHKDPELKAAWKDGMTILEPLVPRVNFGFFRKEAYLENGCGWLVHTEVSSIKPDIPANTVAILDGIFNGDAASAVESITSVIDSLMAPIADVLDVISPDDAEDVGVGRRPANKVANAKKHPVIQALSSNATSATKYAMYYVGQGHCGRVFSKHGDMFASDFGYGILDPTSLENACHINIYNQTHVPILLSHWDKDHYRIAFSPLARDYSHTIYNTSLRTWVAPSNYRGVTSTQLAGAIKQLGTLIIWNTSDEWVRFGNVTIIQCKRNTMYSDPDKNNKGSLALLLGGTDDLFLYPGDANFESIPGIQEMHKRIRHVVATHHGSVRALHGNSRTLGSNIPEACPIGECLALFSYSDNNSYGHDVETAFPYYKKKGYTVAHATAELSAEGKDTMYIRYLSPANNINAPNEPDPTFKHDVLEFVPLPKLSAKDIAEMKRERASPALPPGYVGEFPFIIYLDGSRDPTGDALAKYAVRDEFGDIIAYDVIAQHVVIINTPILIPCDSDHPVTLSIRCAALSISNNGTAVDGVLPFAEFHVRNGEPWVQAAPGENGEKGNPGYAGGRIKIAVANYATLDNAHTLGIKYIGGHGGDGQSGGSGFLGQDGPHGGFRLGPGGAFVFDSRPESGEQGKNGGRGGDAGNPGTIPAPSEIIMAEGKWPGWKFAIDTSDFARPGRPGLGGMYGKGSEYSLDLTGLGRQGERGKEWVSSETLLSNTEVRVRVVKTRADVEQEMASGDWLHEA